MLSRTAENLYWLARYVERAEYLARTIDATLRVTALPAAYIGKTNEWDSALLTAGPWMGTKPSPLRSSLIEAPRSRSDAAARRIRSVISSSVAMPPHNLPRF